MRTVISYNIANYMVYFLLTVQIPNSKANRKLTYPNDGWKTDKEFQNDCLAFTLFHSQNRITSKEGINHWIPFTEQEVDAQEKMESNFMTQFIKGKIKPSEDTNIFTVVEETQNGQNIALSGEQRSDYL